MNVIRYFKNSKLYYWRHLKLLLLIIAVCVTFNTEAQIVLNQNTTSNGASIVTGGNYSGYVSAGQMATYMYANGSVVATQGIILNEISVDIQFTFELSGNLTKNQNVSAGQMVMKSATADLQGTPLSFTWVYLILASDSTVYDFTMTDANGYFIFEQVPYRNFFFTVNSPVISEETPPVNLSFEENPVFIKEVEINGEIGTGGIEASVELTPQLTTGGDSQEYAIWYLDADGDGFGDPNFTVKLNLNAQQSGYVINSLDCNDQDDQINPAAVDEPGSGIDANCDGLYVWYLDEDLDGFGGTQLDTSLYEYPLIGQSENNLDCDDNDPFINPNATDVPGSGIDANCDGIILECSGITNVLITAPVDPVELGNTISIDASYIGDTPFSASWDWGDETSGEGIISEGMVTGSHRYDSAGVYVLSLQLTDSCNTITVQPYKYIVIYDPDGGFVTGSGAIYSPPGASTLYPNAEGYASFGFVSKYDKKLGIPKGNTEFEFDAGELDFVSNEYEWLVVSGAKAKFKGWGSINGQSGFQFMISAIDGDLKQKGDPDIFRIKIWNEETQVVVYDNEMGISINEDPITKITEGSIVIHVPKNNNKSALIGTTDFGFESDLSVNAYPNPTRGKVNLDIDAQNVERIKIRVINITGQRILEKEVKNTRFTELDLSGNTAGVYYIQTQIQDKTVINKIVLKHF